MEARRNRLPVDVGHHALDVDAQRLASYADQGVCGTVGNAELHPIGIVAQLRLAATALDEIQAVRACSRANRKDRPQGTAGFYETLEIVASPEPFGALPLSLGYLGQHRCERDLREGEAPQPHLRPRDDRGAIREVRSFACPL